METDRLTNTVKSDMMNKNKRTQRDCGNKFGKEYPVPNVFPRLRRLKPDSLNLSVNTVVGSGRYV